ncbi:MAG TPA: hypothetical protein VG844_07750 [Terracidiphilus sp.]|nr:hypothetical protein [Terracidiphilus sp.]
MQSAIQTQAIELQALLFEASRALSRFDANRLEELALSCQALNRNLPEIHTSIRALPPAGARTARNHLATLARVIEVTRGNLAVIRQISTFEAGILEYARPSDVWGKGAAHDGDD